MQMQSHPTNARTSDLVSVIIPVYNVEAFLDRCVTSVVNQTYANLEIILVDDGATDSSPELCEQWAKKDARIIVMHKTNGGLSSARNAGITRSSGPWLAFIDSDDWGEPDYIETLHALAMEHEADLAVCSFYDYRTPDHMLDPLKDEVTTGRDLFIEVTQMDNWRYQVAWNKLCARRLCPPGLFPEGKLHEDVFAFPRIVLAAGTVAVTSKPLYHYMVNPNGIMHAKYSIRNLDVIEAMVTRLNIAIDNSLEESYQPIASSIRRYYLREAAVRLPLLSDAAGRRRLLGLVDNYLAALNRIEPFEDAELNELNERLARHPMQTILAIRFSSFRNRVRNKIRHLLSH